MRCAGIGRITLLVTMFATWTVTSLAQNPTPARLSNADVVKMVQAGIPESIIVREIQVSETNFNIAPDALIGLKHQHVPDGVMAAIVESEGGERMARSVAPGIGYSAGPSAAGHPHRLPDVDAAFRIDSRTSGKVEVRANQVKVEKAGVPLFSVRWKENAAK